MTQLKKADAAIRAAYRELWETYGALERLRPLYTQLEDAMLPDVEESDTCREARQLRQTIGDTL